MYLVNRYALYNTYLNLAYNKKCIFFDGYVLEKDKNYFCILQHFGCIRHFFFFKNKKGVLSVRFYLNYSQFCSNFKYIRNYSLVKRQVILSYTSVCVLVREGVLLILSTSYGLLSGDACLFYHCGGILVSIIYI